jgi:predicted deacylase
MARAGAMRHTVDMRPMAPLLPFVALPACVQVPVSMPFPVQVPAVSRVAPADCKPIWKAIGKSVEGLPIRSCAVGTGFRRVLFIGGIHGDETEGRLVTEMLPAAFASVAGLSSQVTLHIVEDMNPDGRRAHARGNSRGVDLNRDFPARNRKTGRGLEQPESRVIHDLILELQPDLVIVAHSWRGDFFINYDGPARQAALRFAALSGFPLRPSTSFAATPGSLGSWCGWDQSIPILTVEWLRGTAPLQAWNSTRHALLAVIKGEIDP